MDTSEQPPKAADDTRANKDWLLAWFASTHSDLQWAKAQSWNAVQWSVLLLAAVYAGSRQFTHISKCVWLIFTILVGGLSIFWLIDLHLFAKNIRKASENIVDFPDRKRYLPTRKMDQHHLVLLAAKILVVAAAAVVTFIEIAWK